MTENKPTLSAEEYNDEGWHASIRFEVLERWLVAVQVRQVIVVDKMTGQMISRTDFYEGP